jgi:hypothetical protein
MKREQRVVQVRASLELGDVCADLLDVSCSCDANRKMMVDRSTQLVVAQVQCDTKSEGPVGHKL